MLTFRKFAEYLGLILVCALFRQYLMVNYNIDPNGRSFIVGSFTFLSYGLGLLHATYKDHDSQSVKK